MKVILLFLGFLGFTVLHVCANFYCEPSLCPPAVLHVGCNETKAFYTKYGYYANVCDKYFRVTTPEFMKYIAVREINGIRSRIAEGSHPQLKTAFRMPVAVWDDELGHLAEMSVRRFRWDGEEVCGNTATYPNVAALYYRNRVENYEQPYVRADFITLFKKAMTEWRQTSKFITPEDVAKPTELMLKNTIFATFINQRANRVGCAVSYCPNEKGAYNYFATCLYSSKNVAMKPIYETGATAKGCLTGTSKCYPALCSEKEVVV